MTPSQISLLISPSGYMKAYISVLHAFVLLSLAVITPFNLAIWLLAIVTVALHWRYCLRRYTSVKHQDWISQLSYSDGQWWLNTNDKRTAVFLYRATIWRWLVVMNFKRDQGWGRYALVLWPDSVDDDNFRRLRVHLRHMNVFGRLSVKD